MNNNEKITNENVISIFSKTMNITFDNVSKDVFRGKYAVNDIHGFQQMFLVIVNVKEYEVKIYTLVPSGKRLFLYDREPNIWLKCLFQIDKYEKANDESVELKTKVLKAINKDFRREKFLSLNHVKQIIDDMTLWTNNTAFLRKRVYSKDYEKYSQHSRIENNAECNYVVFSNRAFASIVTEVHSKGNLETGLVLLGQIKGDTWYVVEAIDPGLNTIHESTFHVMDDIYQNHLFSVLSRLYKESLYLLGLIHRHPGSFDSFSTEDDKTNLKFVQAIGDGTISIIINIDPDLRFSCYYFNGEQYRKVSMFVGDNYFNDTSFLELVSPKDLIEGKSEE